MLLLKLPGVAYFLSFVECARCVQDSPLIASLGGGYFAALIAFAALFPPFPKRPLAFLGLIWALLLGYFFIFVFSKEVCVFCVTAHSFHVLMWLAWLLFPRAHPKTKMGDPARRLMATLLLGGGTFVLFWGGNLGLEEFESKLQVAFMPNVGDEVRPFSLTTIEGKSLSSKQFKKGDRYFFNFVLSKCSYCDEEIPKLEKIAQAYRGTGAHFFNIVERAEKKEVGELRAKFYPLAPHIQVVIDKGQRLRKHFNITSFPTLIVLDGEGKIAKIFMGASLEYDEEFKQILSDTDSISP